MNQEECLFCKIICGDIPCEFVHEDEVCVAFNDISPQAPTHILFIPRVHVASLDKAASNQKETLGHLLFEAAELARKRGFANDGYRIVVNTNSDGGQTVFHLHVHLLAGRQFIFPPG